MIIFFAAMVMLLTSRVIRCTTGMLLVLVLCFLAWVVHPLQILPSHVGISIDGIQRSKGEGSKTTKLMSLIHHDSRYPTEEGNEDVAVVHNDDNWISGNRRRVLMGATTAAIFLPSTVTKSYASDPMIMPPSSSLKAPMLQAESSELNNGLLERYDFEKMEEG